MRMQRTEQAKTRACVQRKEIIVSPCLEVPKSFIIQI